jgi:hypothetical protein
LGQRPDEVRVFNAAMGAKTDGAFSEMLASSDFAGFGPVGDIGGGKWHLLRAMLDAVANARGSRSNCCTRSPRIRGLA